MTCAARSSARISLSAPPRFPTGVRTPSMMNASVTVLLGPRGTRARDIWFSIAPAIRCSRFATSPPGAALPQERARPVAIVAVLGVQRVESLQDRRGADLVAPREQPLRIVHALGHGDVDVARGRDPKVQRVDGLVDEHREHAVEQSLAERAVFRGAGVHGAVAIVVVADLRLAAEPSALHEPPLRERGR